MSEICHRTHMTSFNSKVIVVVLIVSVEQTQRETLSLKGVAMTRGPITDCTWTVDPPPDVISCTWLIKDELKSESITTLFTAEDKIQAGNINL